MFREAWLHLRINKFFQRRRVTHGALGRIPAGSISAVLSHSVECIKVISQDEEEEQVGGRNV